MAISKVLSQWTANEIVYSLRLLIASPPQIFVVAVGPVGKNADDDVRVSAEPVRREDVPKWLSMSEGSRTAAAEFLLSHSLMLEHEERTVGRSGFGAQGSGGVEPRRTRGRDISRQETRDTQEYDRAGNGDRVARLDRKQNES